MTNTPANLPEPPDADVRALHEAIETYDKHRYTMDCLLQVIALARAADLSEPEYIEPVEHPVGGSLEESASAAISTTKSLWFEMAGLTVGLMNAAVEAALKLEGTAYFEVVRHRGESGPVRGGWSMTWHGVEHELLVREELRGGR